MRHRLRGRGLSRDSEHRKALRRHLAQSIFEHGSIKTTHAKAKEVKSFVEKLITLARDAAKAPKGDAGKAVKLNARRKAFSMLNDRRLVDENQDFIEEGKGPRTILEKLFDEIGPSMSDRNGGYTRIIKLADWRIGDAGDVVQFELVTKTEKPKGSARRAAGARKKRAERKTSFAKKALKAKGDKKAEAAA
ncbi:MAG TPA: 50S ribosomal protein L17 [Tepidisphaeraceae bacterium]|nr:50S ribosomal protein L17 [Tepidisphaeraceae bacterium]